MGSTCRQPWALLRMPGDCLTVGKVLLPSMVGLPCRVADGSLGTLQSPCLAEISGRTFERFYQLHSFLDTFGTYLLSPLSPSI